MTALDRLIEDAHSFDATRRDRQIYGLLGRWVSEMEPTVVYGPRMELLGLAGPDGTIVKHA